MSLSQYCKKGHDQELTGRVEGSRCRICREISQKQNSERLRNDKDRWRRRIAYSRQWTRRNAVGIKNLPVEPTGELPCDLCKTPIIKFNADHDHKTLEFRGWVCTECNTGLGAFGDDIFGLKQALVYLETVKQRHPN